jgi:hypothetical protein
MRVVNNLEHLLRRHKRRLCAEAAARYRRSAGSDNPATETDRLALVGAEYTHELILIAAALYPSETTLRNQYQWASTGQLRQRGIGHDQQAAMLHGYFDAARQLRGLGTTTQAALADLEHFMAHILGEAFKAGNRSST